MRLTILLLTVGFLHANAGGMAQNITLSGKDISLKQVFEAVKRQTGYVAFSTNKLIFSGSRPVSVHVAEMPLAELLDMVLKDQPISYTIQTKTIFLFRKTKYEQPSSSSMVEQKAAPQPVSGRIIDSLDAPIEGASIRLTPGNIGTFSKADGSFVIANVEPGSYTLEVTSVGHLKVKMPVTVDASTPLTIKTITLRSNPTAMEEILVVNTGYQQIRKERSTGASTSLTADQLQTRFTPNIMDNLEGRVPGLVKYGDRVTIRGTGTLFAESRPLLVVDGIPVEMAYEDINPYDVQTVTILKDAAATAIYGARASNGVIIVTTKKATNLNKIEVEISSNTTIWEKQNVDHADNWYMTAEQQVDRENQYFKWLYSESPNANAELTKMANALAGTGSFEMNPTPIQYDHYLLKTGTIDQKELESRQAKYKTQNFAKEYADHILRQRVLQMHNVSVRNRTNNFQSNLVLNYKADNMGKVSDKSNQLNIFYKGVYDMKPWLTINFSVNNILQRATERRSNYVENIMDPFSVPAYYSLFNPDGSQANISPGWTHFYNPYSKWVENNKALSPMHYHLLDEINLNKHKIEKQNTRYHGELLFKIMKGFTLNTQYVYEVNRQSVTNNSEASSYLMRLMRNAYTVRNPNGTYRYLIPQTGGRLATENIEGNHWTARAQANFSRIINRVHNLDVLAGVEFRETDTKGSRNLYLGWDDQLQSQSTTNVNYNELWNIINTSYYAPGFPARQFLFIPFIENAISLNVAGNNLSEVRRRNASGYANLTYSYDRRYNVFGSIRKDYADVYGLATEFRGAPFGSVGASWNLSNERFMERYKEVDLLKLRASYGYTGNIYQGATSYMTANTGLINNYTGLPRASIESPGNPELSWEKTGTINLGAEFAWFDSRLRGVIDWYNKKSEKVFSNQTLEVTTGFSSLVMNMASVKNNGLELTLAYDWFRAKNRNGFSWTTSMIGSWNRNEVTRVEIQATSASQVINIGYKEGYPVRSLFSYRFAGLTSTGVQSWYDEVGKIIPDVGIARATPGSVYFTGQADPKYTYSMENQLAWKGFSLNLLMVFYGGHHMRANQVQASPYPGAVPLRSWYLNAWTPEKTNTTIPGIWEYNAVTATQPLVQNNTDIFVHSADFLKIRNFVLGYDLPQTATHKIGLNNLRLRFQMNNLPAIWKSNDIGVDPETLGIRLPASYVFGVNFNF